MDKLPYESNSNAAELKKFSTWIADRFILFLKVTDPQFFLRHVVSMKAVFYDNKIYIPILKEYKKLINIDANQTEEISFC